MVGGGAVAERKVKGLLEAGAQVRVVTLQATAELHGRSAKGEIELRLAPYRTEELTGALLVFAATDQRDINASIKAEAARIGALVNVADVAEEGDFVTPSVVRRGDLCFSVSTGGSQPMLAARIAADLEARYGPEYAAWVDLLGRVRGEIKQNCVEAADRRAAMSALLAAESDIRPLLDRGETEAALGLARDIANQKAGGCDQQR